MSYTGTGLAVRSPSALTRRAAPPRPAGLGGFFDDQLPNFFKKAIRYQGAYIVSPFLDQPTAKKMFGLSKGESKVFQITANIQRAVALAAVGAGIAAASVPALAVDVPGVAVADGAVTATTWAPAGSETVPVAVAAGAATAAESAPAETDEAPAVTVTDGAVTATASEPALSVSPAASGVVLGATGPIVRMPRWNTGRWNGIATDTPGVAATADGNDSATDTASTVTV